MTTGIRRHLPRFIASLLFAIGILVGGLGTPALAASTTGQGAQTSSQASRPQWGINGGTNGWSPYQCCYPGKGEDTLFIHGVDTTGLGADGHDPNGNCYVNWSNAANLLSDSSHQWVGNLIAVQYYNGDHCDMTQPHPLNFSAINIPSHDTTHCALWDSGSNDGTNNEDDRHVSCMIAWWIWENYTNFGWKVNVVAHSLGGVFIKWALYEIYVKHNTVANGGPFPNALSLDHVVTFSSPLTGIIQGADEICGECVQLLQLEWGVVYGIYGDLTDPAAMTAGQAQGVHWLMEGEVVGPNIGCDENGGSAFGLNYGIKVDYSYILSNISTLRDACNDGLGGGNSWYYGHGTYQVDSQTIYNATVNYCNGCSGYPGTVTYNFPRSLVEMYWGLTGNCAASPGTTTCDGDDSAQTGCNSTGYLQSGDVSYLKIYWSTGCSTNWASVAVPPGSGSYLVKVTLARSPTGSWSNVDRHFIYCAPSRTTCPEDTWASFGPNTPSWVTDMVYAPNEKVAVQIVTTTGTYTSIWH